MKSSCKGCEKRVIGCHSTCEEYIANKAKTEEARKKRNMENEMKDYIIVRSIERKRKWDRANGKK